MGYLPQRHSIDNTMAPTQIIVGEELNGTTSGYSAYTDWTNNRYIESTGVHYYQFRDGDKKIQNGTII